MHVRDMKDRILFKIGHIDFKKDTYDVLLNTIATLLNNSMNTINHSNLCFDRNSTTSMFLFKSVLTQINNNDTIKWSIVMTGDLAFYFTCLGRENMASTWCCWCSSSKSQWKKIL